MILCKHFLSCWGFPHCTPGPGRPPCCGGSPEPHWRTPPRLLLCRSSRTSPHTHPELPFNLVGHTQNRRHNKYLEPFHCGGILRRKINNIWESKSHSSLIQTKWQTEWFLIGVTVVIRVWHGGSGSDVRRNIHWRLLSRSKLVLNTCQYYTSIVYRFPIVHFNGLNWDKITVILLVLFGYPVIHGIPGILCNYINRHY